MIDFQAAQNIHENGILKTTITPAPIEAHTAKKAKKIAMQIAEYLGVE
jgi:phosphoribosylaminoimidazole carboxylase (NCAIR synthetase)